MSTGYFYLMDVMEDDLVSKWGKGEKILKEKQKELWFVPVVGLSIALFSVIYGIGRIGYGIYQIYKNLLRQGVEYNGKNIGHLHLSRGTDFVFGSLKNTICLGFGGKLVLNK